MRPTPKKDDGGPSLSSTQLEITKTAMGAAAEITAAMVTVTNEKNPAKISEAYRTIYKSIMETVRGSQKKSS